MSLAPVLRTATLAAFLLPIPAMAGPVETLDDGSKIEVVSKGKGEKAVIALALEPGTSAEWSTENTMNMTMGMGGMPMPSPGIPTTVLSSTLTVDSVAEDGSAKISYVYAKPEIQAAEGGDPAVLSAVTESLAGYEGKTGSSTVSSNGQVSNSQATLPDGLTDEQKLNANASPTDGFIPFPTTPLGVGARWTRTSIEASNGLSIEQQITYELVSREGSVIQLNCTIAQEPTSKEVTLPNLPPGATAQLAEFEGKGGGTMTWDLTKPAPSVYSLNVDVKMDMAIDAMGQQMNMTMSMESGVKGSSK